MEGTRIRRTLRTVKNTPLWVVLVLTLRNNGSAVAFSATPPPPPPSSSPSIHHAFIELVDLVALNKADTKLPASFIDTWPTWIFQTNVDGGDSPTFTKIPDDDGFVSPSSTDTLYQPLDLKAPTCTLALGFHIRDGTIRHVFPALDIGYHDEKQQQQQQQHQHRNRGLCSVPRAYKWIEYSLGLAGEWHTFGLQAHIRKVAPGDDEGGWQSRALLSPGTCVLAKTIDQLQYALAEDPPAELGEGSHILHALLPVEEDGNTSPISFEQPMTGHEICVTLCEDDEEEDFGDTKIVVVPTPVSQQPQKLDPTTSSSGGILHVQVEATMAGSESEYLPDAYKPLYHDLELRNPRYQRYQERRKEGSIPTTNNNE